MAGKLRQLARLARTPFMRWELADLARRYDLRGDHFDSREGSGGQPRDRCAPAASGLDAELAAHLDRRLSLPQPLINHLAQQSYCPSS